MREVLVRVGAITLAFAVVGAGCGEDAPVLPDACVAAASTMQLVTPNTYACRENFTAQLAVTNHGCAPLTIEDIQVTAVVQSGACAPAAPVTYTPLRRSVGVGITSQVLDLTGGAFCCLAPGCPTPLDCVEEFTFTVNTSAGPLVATGTASLDLDGCDVLCE
jgi:hypothetical protein